eukprot:2383729-Pyramimonas_sp.AAC.1
MSSADCRRLCRSSFPDVAAISASICRCSPRPAAARRSALGDVAAPAPLYLDAETRAPVPRIANYRRGARF